LTEDKDEYSKAYQIDFKGFEFALVSYTPISRKIHTISTHKKVEDCLQEPIIIAGILEKKFGQNLINKRNEIKNTYYMGKHPTGLRGISLICNYNFKQLEYFIQITVSDLDISDEGDKELIELSTKDEIDKL